ncbi:hypothetical protein FHG87_004465, partial [Trinorchestia longiramus]
MSAEKKLCAGIMLCQMTAILSGVALLYLAVIVVIPSKEELGLGFSTTPIMCTTVQAEDISLHEPKGDKKADCDWVTCGEWCLSKTASPCMQIHVLARKNGSKVTFHNCVDIEQRECSGLDVNKTQIWKCKKGQCKNLQGLFNCTREDDNVCREMTAAFDCKGKTISPTKVLCNEEKCEKRLHGVNSCSEGACNEVKNVSIYWKDCTRRCTDLHVGERNTVIFSKEKLITSECSGVTSSSASVDNNTIEVLNSDTGWTSKNKVAFLFCTYTRKEMGKEQNYELVLEDCFNGTLGDAIRVRNVTDYRDLLTYHKELTAKSSELLINTEESLGVMNVTKLLINPQGCSNTLNSACKKFFEGHATDGLDGKTADRFPCYFTDKDYSFVIGQYNPKNTFVFLILASVVPGALFIFACFVLFLCSKSVGVNDEGHLHLTLLKGAGNGGKTD